jgi:hypothetical protein
MNITGMIREGSLADHTWWDKGLIHEGVKSFDPASCGSESNNNKPEAEIQWGYQHIPVVYSDEMPDEVDRNIPEYAQGDAGMSIRFARDLMNQGASAEVIDRELRARFSKDALHADAEGLRELFSMDGLIGRILIDARGYNDCAEAVKLASRSPYKRFIKCVMGCECGDHHMVPVEDDVMEVVASTGNAVDDFFTGQTPYEPRMVAHCRTTMLPVIAGIDDLDESWINKNMIDISDVLDTSKDNSVIESGAESVISKIKSAFRNMDKARARKGRQRYSEPVDVSDHIIKACESEIELAPLVEYDEIDANPIENSIDADPMLDDVVIDMTEEHGGIFAGCDEIALDAQRESQADIDIELDDSSMEW